MHNCTWHIFSLSFSTREYSLQDRVGTFVDNIKMQIIVYICRYYNTVILFNIDHHLNDNNYIILLYNIGF